MHYANILAQEKFISIRSTCYELPSVIIDERRRRSSKQEALKVHPEEIR